MKAEEDGGALILAEDGSPTWKYRVAPFRAAYEKSGMTIAELSRTVGWKYPWYASRVLGLRVDSYVQVRNGKRYHVGHIRQHVSYEVASKLAIALNMDLTEVGL